MEQKKDSNNKEEENFPGGNEENDFNLIADLTSDDKTDEPKLLDEKKETNDNIIFGTQSNKKTRNVMRIMLISLAYFGFRCPPF